MHKILAGLVLVFMPTAAMAHVGVAEISGFAAGFLHPLAGLDHILTMAAVGVLAALSGGKARWLLPLSFLTMMTLAAAAAISGVSPPFIEAGIALSVLVFGAILAFGAAVPLAAAMALAGGFAVFHGAAHGGEIPQSASGLSYAAGFFCATALLHAGGLALGLTARPGRSAAGALRLAGAAMALFGGALLLGGS
jgi:urease accessory protein